MDNPISKLKPFLPSLTGILLIFSLLVIPPILRHSARIEMTMASFEMNLGITWIVTGILFSLIWFWEKLGLSSIGIRRITRKDLLWTVIGVFVFAACAGAAASLGNMLHLQAMEKANAEFSKLPSWLLLFGLANQSVVEEIWFRGYLIERLQKLIGNVYLAALVSHLLFAAAHAPLWGVGGAVVIGVASLPLPATYALTRNLWPCVLIHFAGNATQFLMMMSIHH